MLFLQLKIIEKAPKMENKKSGKVVVILAILLVVIAGYALYSNANYSALSEELEAEKAEIKKELDELVVQYDAKIAEGTSLKAKLTAAREDIVSYRDSLTSEKKTSYAAIRRYKNRVYSLQAKNKELFAQVDSLTTQNGKLNEEIVAAKETIEAQSAENAELTAKNAELEGKVAIGAVLSAGSLNAVAMKKSSTGALSETSKYKKTDAFRISFVINKNELTNAGDKEAFLVIKDAEGTVVAPKGKVKIDGKEVYYSDTTTIDYQNVETDVIVITEVNRKETKKGIYTVSAFVDGVSVGSANVKLKGGWF